MCLMLLFGTSNTVIMKLMDGIKVTNKDGKLENFTHPYFQCANMFVGEFGCLLVYYLKKWYTERKQAKISEGESQEVPLSPGTKLANQTALKTTINPLYLAIPASCDICGSTLMFVALT